MGKQDDKNKKNLINRLWWTGSKRVDALKTVRDFFQHDDRQRHFFGNVFRRGEFDVSVKNLLMQ